MKVTFDKAKLLAALIPASGISQVKNTITTVDGLLFECPPNARYGAFDGDAQTTCRISAFDLEKGLQTTVSCRIEEEGMYVINTSKILQIIKVLPDGEITIEIDARNRVRVTGGQSNFEITAQNGMDFPTMPMFKGDRVYTLPQHTVRDIIDATAFAVAQNDQRPAFNGALLRIQDGVFTMVGSDGNRLAIARTVLPDPDSAPDAEMVIPGKYLLELSRMLRDTEEDTTMILARKHIIFKIDDIYFFTRMIEHAYMQYERVLPQVYRSQCYVSAAELTGAIERASLVTEDRLGGNSKPYLKLTFARDHIEIYSVSSGGSIEESVRRLWRGTRSSSVSRAGCCWIPCARSRPIRRPCGSGSIPPSWASPSNPPRSRRCAMRLRIPRCSATGCWIRRPPKSRTETYSKACIS